MYMNIHLRLIRQEKVGNMPTSIDKFTSLMFWPVKLRNIFLPDFPVDEEVVFGAFQSPKVFFKLCCGTLALMFKRCFAVIIFKLETIGKNILSKKCIVSTKLTVKTVFIKANHLFHAF